MAAVDADGEWSELSQPMPEHVVCQMQKDAVSIDGGGWELVRMIPKGSSKWHASGDNLEGTASYDTNAGWSKQFSNLPIQEYLFASVVMVD